MRFKNASEHTVNLDAIGLDPVEAGAECEVPLDLCAPGRRDNGGRSKSALECVAPQLVPVSSDDHAAWQETPPPPVPTSKIVSINVPRQMTEAPGVKALREKREANAAKASSSPVVNASTTPVAK